MDEQTMHVSALAAAVERMTMAVQELAAVNGEKKRGARLPWRNVAVALQPAMARNGRVKLTWIHATNELGVADAYLQLYDDYDADAISVGETVPKLTLLLSAGGAIDDVLDGEAQVEFHRGIVVSASANRNGSGAPNHSVLVNLVTVPL
jgi:hypothetical protein